MKNLTDAINFASMKGTVECAFRIINGVQHHKIVGERVLAMACVFVLLCERFNICPREVIGKAERFMKDTDKVTYVTQISAIKEYLNKEMHEDIR